MNIMDVLFVVLIIIIAILIAVIMIGKQQKQAPVPDSAFGRKMAKLTKKVWQFGKVWFISSAFVIVIILLKILVEKHPVWKFWIAGSLILFILLVIGLLVGLAIIALNSSKDKGDIIRNVPENHAWVIRFAFWSNPGDETENPKGYFALREGWKIYIPGFFKDMGFVDLAPKPRDPNSITVNTADNQTAEVDWRIETVISDPIKFMVRVRNSEEREKFEDQRSGIIFAQKCSQHTQENLTIFGNEALKKMGDEAKDNFNQQMDFFGIQARDLSIQKILPPTEIRDTAEYATITNQRAKIAVTKAAELKAIIEGTTTDAAQTNPTQVVIADIIRGGLIDLAELFLPFLGKKGKEKEEGK